MGGGTLWGHKWGTITVRCDELLISIPKEARI